MLKGLPVLQPYTLIVTNFRKNFNKIPVIYFKKRTQMKDEFEAQSYKMVRFSKKQSSWLKQDSVYEACFLFSLQLR